MIRQLTGSEVRCTRTDADGKPLEVRGACVGAWPQEDGWLLLAISPFRPPDRDATPPVCLVTLGPHGGGWTVRIERWT